MISLPMISLLMISLLMISCTGFLRTMRLVPPIILCGLVFAGQLFGNNASHAQGATEHPHYKIHMGSWSNEQTPPRASRYEIANVNDLLSNFLANLRVRGAPQSFIRSYTDTNRCAIALQ